MSDRVIQVEQLGKRYRIGALRPKYHTLRDALTSGARRIARGAWGHLRGDGSKDNGDDTVWALRNVSFDVQRGEVLGIIGRNGAGKSTLLKVLSRITEPTTGSIRIRGRVGSLLEVGTGFHPELTGRENVFLNGAILGMHRAEVDAKFDEIVAFAEVERFIDTPVKHYSSGMYLRLAFAVAAHLEPEILIVDEVLAVGDASFQKKCLGKMGDVAQQGRTVLFVSHNMDAVRRLCSRCVLLEAGEVATDGKPAGVISRYLSRGLASGAPGTRIDLAAADRIGSGTVRFLSARFSSHDDRAGLHAFPNGPLELVLEVASDSPRSVESLAVSLRTQGGTLLVNADVVSLGHAIELEQGQNTVVFRIEALHLNPGTYVASLWAGDALDTTFDYVEEAFEINVVPLGLKGLGVTPKNNGVVSCQFEIHTEACLDPPATTYFQAITMGDG